MNGVLTLAGLLDVDFISLFENSVLPSDVFTVATADSAILGSFSNVASGSRVGTNTLKTLEVWYGAGSPYGAENLVLTQAPEPSRALLMMLGFAGVMMEKAAQVVGLQGKRPARQTNSPRFSPRQPERLPDYLGWRSGNKCRKPSSRGHRPRLPFDLRLRR